jgi:hypothetical protein
MLGVLESISQPRYDIDHDIDIDKFYNYTRDEFWPKQGLN